MQRYKEHRRANITLSHFLLVIDYQRFKVIGGSIINNKKREVTTYLSYSTCKEYLHVQLLFSLTLNEVQYIPLLKISGVPSLFAFSVRNVTSSNHSIQCCIRNVKLLLDLLGAQHRVESIRQIVLTKVFYLIAAHSASSYLLPSLLLLVCSKARVRQRF